MAVTPVSTEDEDELDKPSRNIRPKVPRPVMKKPSGLSPLAEHMEQIPEGINPIDWLRKFKEA